MRLRHRIARLTAVSALGAGVLFGGLGSTAQAAPVRSCHHLSLHLSKHIVKTGGVVRVHGSTCRKAHPRWVKVRVRAPHGWRRIGLAHTRANGHFSKRVRVRVGVGQRRGTKVQATSTHVKSNTVSLAIEGAEGFIAPAGSGCSLANPASQADLTISGCRQIYNDTAEIRNPTQFWGHIDCGVWPNSLAPGQASQVLSGGDDHLTASGHEQGNDSFRRMTVYDGDDVAGERCELGFNDNVEGPTALYREGDRRVTFASLRLPENFPLEAQTWQTVLQMKQAQPAANAGGVPILEMQAFDGRFWVSSDKGVYFSFPATRDIWTRFVFDVTYSRHASEGSVQVSVDLNDDGDLDDPGERSPRKSGATLKTETAGGGPDTIAPGESIPSHLRVGIYHNPSIACPRNTGCSTEVDNVQVLAP